MVLAIGAGIFYQKGGVPKVAPIAPSHLTGTGYAAIPMPELSTPKPLWEPAPDQGEDRNDPGWVYSIFTPPKIWWETGTGWIVIPPNPEVPPPPFGVHLVKSGEELYRVQVEGVSGAGDKNDIINFSDEEDGNDFQLKVGDESILHQIKVLDMTVPDQPDVSHGLWNKNAVVTILDERTNQQLQLTQGVLFSPTGNRYCVLQFEEPFGTQEWTVTKVGDTQEFPGSTMNLPDNVEFVVDAIDFDTPSVTVERQTKNRHHNPVPPVIETLKLPDLTAVAAPEPAVSDNTPTKKIPPHQTSRLPAQPPPQPPATSATAASSAYTGIGHAASTSQKATSQSVGDNSHSSRSGNSKSR